MASLLFEIWIYGYIPLFVQCTIEEIRNPSGTFKWYEALQPLVWPFMLLILLALIALKTIAYFRKLKS